LIISLLFVFIYPPVAFPFFLGYGIHLLADSFTVEGIAPFWPLDKRLNGRITTGGKIEHLFFVIFIIIDVVMLVGIIVPFV
jgi:membrane-bound metal-dependent hydrolase YbcI (DUF457 family)